MLVAAINAPTTIGVFNGMSEGLETSGLSSSEGTSSSGFSDGSEPGSVVWFLGTLKTVKYPDPVNYVVKLPSAS